MAITPNTELRLIKCPLNLDNKNQITFDDQEDQAEYFQSLDYIESGDSDISYQRHDGIIRVDKHIDSILEYNYCMYKNNNYSDKWFYSFIVNMEYVNDHRTDVKILTDVFHTWQCDITYNQCFVEREHVNDDTVGLHTVPENVETGEYICNSHYKDSTMDNYSSDLCFIMASTSEPIARRSKRYSSTNRKI